MSRAIRSKFRIVGALVLMFTMIFAMAVSVKAAGPGRQYHNDQSSGSGNGCGFFKREVCLHHWK